ncbi:unnamed protein product [Pedinophyceae sp. YPF-701]|nr:unnamed protein product [Pedinophyceae sp. YPF-701]
MVRVESNDVLGLNSTLPAFSLPDPRSGSQVSSEDLKGAPSLVIFMCNHCPFVVLLKEAIASLTKEYAGKGVKIVAISSNDAAAYPQDGPDMMAKDAEAHAYCFPYVFDETQEVAKAFGVMCTPEFFVADAAGVLKYHGRFDAATPGNGKEVTGADLRAALDAVLAGKPVESQPRSMGCNLKWKAGNEPAYFALP